MKPKTQVLEVWGEFACFTRPELKVERFSYPVITPSAARAIFDAIYCKPNKNPSKAEFRWQIKKVEVLSEPKYIALRRNEVKEKAPSTSTILSWATGGREPEPIIADGTKDVLGTDQRGRTQRQTMALKDVRYRLHAEIRPWPGFEDRIQGMEAQFRRRASCGKCIYQPYLGCREFPAYFELVEPGLPLCEPLPLNVDIGLMLYDVFDLSRPCSADEKPQVSLFRAKVENGILLVPEYENGDEVFKVDGGRY
ncbi:MAG: type I-C CRISPR-associated protein Cas5c [Actinomycetota bacterium]|nr:type I-C CRISPR-associated protein Cas5c [Actinomycetota bacterium]MDD5666470.1 type I-C CRISPR-associated protein Cas5c [Actinomycetota bacterium]